ncbi:TPA: SGNH/GDSL hydrolase family protein, partial [Klebsiella pneumoniae]
PVVTQDGLTLDFTGSSVVVDRVSYPFAGTVTLDSTPLEYGPVNNYTLRPAAANSQWPSNPNAWIGRKRVSNVVVTDVATGNTLTPGVEYNVDGYGGKLRGLTTATYTVNMTLNYLNERYDLIQIDPITLELSVVKGTIRIFDVQEYRPAVQAGKVPLFYALVAGSTVELEPVYRWPETGYDLQGNTDADLLRLHNRRCLQKTLARLNQGKPITLLGYGDSITAVSNIASPDTTPNGSTRDLQRILQGYATDTLTNFYPAQDWGDGGGAVHVKIGWNWRLKEWMESTFGVEVNYQNLGVSGTNSSSGAGSTRLNAAKATSPHVAVVCFGMNDNAGSTLYSNLMTIIAGLKSVGSDVVLMPVPRTPSHEDGRYTLDQWRYMNSQVYRAAMDGGAAYVPANWLTDDNSRGGMGIVPTSLCGSDLRNHPGGYEFSVYGKALVNTFC